MKVNKDTLQTATQLFTVDIIVFGLFRSTTRNIYFLTLKIYIL